MQFETATRVSDSNGAYNEDNQPRLQFRSTLVEPELRKNTYAFLTSNNCTNNKYNSNDNNNSNTDDDNNNNTNTDDNDNNPSTDTSNTNNNTNDNNTDSNGLDSNGTNTNNSSIPNNEKNATFNILSEYFDESFANKYMQLLQTCSILIGMHPDQATEAIVDMAIKFNKPFAIVPCCVFQKLFPNRKLSNGINVKTYGGFLRYLRAKHPCIEVHVLPLKCKNIVLFWRGSPTTTTTTTVNSLL